MRIRAQEERAIDLVLSAINTALGTSYEVVQRPDRQNRDGKAIDAWAEEATAPPLAIEHTRLETFQGQTRDDAWFMTGLGPLEGTALPCLLRLWPPHLNVAPGQDWNDIRNRVGSWATANATTLPMGVSLHHVSGVPFPLLVDKQSEGAPGIRLGRLAPGGDRPEQLLATMDMALDHKHEELARYQSEGAIAVLVLESNDIALTNEGEIYRAFVRATSHRPRPWLDQIWLVRTEVGDRPYCFFGSDELIAAVNPENLCFGPRYREMWLRKPRAEIQVREI